MVLLRECPIMVSSRHSVTITVQTKSTSRPATKSRRKTKLTVVSKSDGWRRESRESVKSLDLVCMVVIRMAGFPAASGAAREVPVFYRFVELATPVREPSLSLNSRRDKQPAAVPIKVKLSKGRAVIQLRARRLVRG